MKQKNYFSNFFWKRERERKRKKREKRIKEKKKNETVGLRVGWGFWVGARKWVASGGVRNFFNKIQTGCMPISGKWNKNKNWKLHARKPHL